MPHVIHPVAIVAAVVLACADQAIAEPKRPASNWNQCSPTGDQINRLKTANPGAMEACSQMAQQAQAQGRSFAFMCDPNGSVACCNDTNCVQVGSAVKPLPPGGLRPGQMPQGTFQVPPGSPGGRPGVAPPGGAMQPQGTR